jgi:hypothetical protein
MVTAGPSKFFAYLPWTISIKCGIMSVHVRGTVFWNLLHYKQMHLENLNYDISLFCSLEFQATCAHSVWRYVFEIAFWCVREFIITRNVCMQQVETQPTG